MTTPLLVFGVAAVVKILVTLIVVLLPLGVVLFLFGSGKEM